MTRPRRAFAVALLFLCLTPSVQGRQQPPAAAATLSPEEMETFLRSASIKKKASTRKGTTDTIRATLSDGRLTHDAQIQTVDVEKSLFAAGKATETNFKDSWRFNVGGYRLARLLGMNNVPMSVKRLVDGKDAAVTWWIDDVMFDEQGRMKHTPRQGPDPDRTAKQTYTRYIFDELIQNRDRNQGNLIWTKDWTLWLIDHTRAFRLGRTLMKPDNLTRVDRALLASLRALSFDAMNSAMGDVLTKDEMNAVIFRRDLIVKHFEERVALVGEAVVLFTM